MEVNRLEKINNFVENYIYHNSVFVQSTDKDKARAINQSALTLVTRLKDHFENEEAIPTDVLAQQAVWLMMIDDTFLRADLGATYIQMSGVMVNIKDKDRSIAPYVLSHLGITPDALTGGLTQRKVGRYISRPIGINTSRYRG